MNGSVMIMAGGTGGHVFPALAVAHALRDRGREVTWLGTRQGLEARIVPRSGFEMEWIEIQGIRGKDWQVRLRAPGRIFTALRQARQILVRRKPSVVIGFGGFVSGPAGLMAAFTGIPLLIHEQNAVPGLTNKWLARLARAVYTGFPITLPGADSRIHYVGNPVRRDIVALPEPEVRMHLRQQEKLHLLVIGGSQGAATLNRLVPLALSRLDVGRYPEVRHQTGERHLLATRDNYAAAGVLAEVSPFIEDMAAAYAWADLVVCRAGALTVSELTAAGVAALLIPYPYAADDHQRANADFLVRAGAAHMQLENALTAEALATELQELLSRPRLLPMAQAARVLGRRQAADELADGCLRWLDQ